MTEIVSRPLAASATPEDIAAPSPMFPERTPPRTPAAVTGIFVLLAFYTLYFAAPVLIPVAVAFLLSVLLSPFVDRLERLHVNRVLGAALVIAIVFGTLSVGIVTVAAPAQDWLKQLPANFKKVEQKIRVFKKPLQDFERATQQIENATELSDRVPRVKVEVQRPGLLEDIFSGTQRPIASVGVTLILTLSLLASGERFLRKFLDTIPPGSDREHAAAIAGSIRHDLFYYLAGITLINTSLGLSVGLLAYTLDLGNALLWGSVVAVIAFVPYVGSLTNMLILLVAGLVRYDTAAQALALPAIFLVLSTFVSSVAVPYVLGRRLLLSPIAIFLAILLWGWMWGIIGAVLAVPLLVSFKIICERFKSLQPIATILSP